LEEILHVHAFLTILVVLQIVVPNVRWILNVPANTLVSIKDVKTHVLDHAVMTQNVESSTIFQFVHVEKVSLEIHLFRVVESQWRNVRCPKIYVIHLLAAAMLVVITELALVCRNIKAIHTQDVVRNVFSAMIAQETEHVQETNASILVPEHVEKMLSVKLSTIYRSAHVETTMKEMLLHAVRLDKKILSFLVIHAIRRLVDQTHNVEK